MACRKRWPQIPTYKYPFTQCRNRLTKRFMYVYTICICMHTSARLLPSMPVSALHCMYAMCPYTTLTPVPMPAQVPAVPATLDHSLHTRSAQACTHPQTSTYRYLTMPCALCTPGACSVHMHASLTPIPMPTQTPAVPATLD